MSATKKTADYSPAQAVPTNGSKNQDFIAENLVGVLPLRPDLEPPQWFEDWVRGIIYNKPLEQSE